MNRVLSLSAKTGMRENEAYRRIFGMVGPPNRSPEPRPASANRDPLECPICGVTNDRFLNFGLDCRADAQRPNCGSLERHRILWLYLAERTDYLQWPRKLLHTGPESCLEPRLRACNGAGYVTTDRYNRRVDVCADLKALPFGDAAFDAILSSHVLEHIEDDGRAIQEISRVLRSGGNATIMVPYDPQNTTYYDPELTTPAERLSAYGHPFHYRIYGHDLLDRLAEAGLTPRVWSAKELFSPAQWRRYRLNNSHLLACEKI